MDFLNRRFKKLNKLMYSLILVFKWMFSMSQAILYANSIEVLETSSLPKPNSATLDLISAFMQEMKKT